MKVLLSGAVGILFYFTCVCLRGNFIFPKKVFQVITSMFSSFKYDNYFQKNYIYFYYRMLFYAFRRIAKCTLLLCTITVEICIRGFTLSSPLPSHFSSYLECTC